jgi:hypothetical protein
LVSLIIGNVPQQLTTDTMKKYPRQTMGFWPRVRAHALRTPVTTRNGALRAPTPKAPSLFLFISQK